MNIRPVITLTKSNALQVLRDCQYSDNFTPKGFDIAWALWLDTARDAGDAFPLFEPAEFCTEFAEYEAHYLIDYLGLESELGELVDQYDGDRDAAAGEVLDNYLSIHAVQYEAFTNKAGDLCYIVQGLD